MHKEASVDLTSIVGVLSLGDIFNSSCVVIVSMSGGA